MTADKEIICIHDADTSRTAPAAPGVVDVRTVRYNQLATYDVGSWKGDKYKGPRTPRLPEILAELPDSAMIYIEIKQDSPRIIPRVLEEIEAGRVRLEQVTLISFSPAIVKRTKEIAPTDWISAEMSGLTTGWLRHCAPAGLNFMSGP